MQFILVFLYLKIKNFSPCINHNGSVLLKNVPYVVEIKQSKSNLSTFVSHSKWSY